MQDDSNVRSEEGESVGSRLLSDSVNYNVWPQDYIFQNVVRMGLVCWVYQGGRSLDIQCADVVAIVVVHVPVK